MLPAVHWSKRSLTDTNKTLWGSYLIEYKGKKILFACDTGYGEIYKDLGKKFGPIDLTIINIGAYNFKPMFDKSIYHTNPHPRESSTLRRGLKLQSHRCVPSRQKQSQEHTLIFLDRRRHPPRPFGTILFESNQTKASPYFVRYTQSTQERETMSQILIR